MRVLIALALLAALTPAYAQPASTDLKGSRINLDARASEEVDNDVMHATLFVEAEDEDAGKLAEKINQLTNDSMKLAKSFSGVRTKTSGYSTYPVTEKSRIVRWRSRSEISLEGEDFRRMSEAIGKLQAIMQLGSVGFSVAPAKRAKVEEALTQSAIAEFLRKADAATKGFKGSKFRVIEAAISADGGNMPPPRPMMMKAMSDSTPAAAAMEGGTSRITVTVSGAILIPR